MEQMTRETADYLLGLVLDERIRLERRVWYKGEEIARRDAFAKNDRARRVVVDLLEEL